MGRQLKNCVLSTSVLILTLTYSANAHEGWGIVIHDELGIVISDIPGNTIWRIAGNRVEPLIRNIHSHALAAGVDGAIYGTHVEPSGASSSIWRVDSAGRVSYVLPPTRDFALGLQSFLMTTDGTIYSANRYDHQRPTITLIRREPNGNLTTLAGGMPGFADGRGETARFSGIDGMRQGPERELLIVDGAHVRVVTPEGIVSTLTAPLTTPRWGEDLLGMSSIRADTVHIADHAGRRILRISLRTGQADEVDRSDFFWAPAGVEITDVALYVLEHLRPPLSLLGDLQIGPYLRVRRVTASSTTLAVVWGRYTWSAAVGTVLSIIFAGAMWRAWRRRR